MRSVAKRAGSLFVWLEPFFLLALPLAIGCLLVSAAGPVMSRVVVELLVRLTVVIGLSVFVGNSGILSFGHAAFMIVAAYASAWLTIPPVMKGILLPELPAMLRAAQVHPAIGLVVAVVLCTALALIVGAVLLRLSGIAASIATFAFFDVVATIYGNWTAWTKGTASLVGVPIYVTPQVAIGLAILALLVAHLYRTSRRGLLLRATREDEVAASASGISVYGERLFAFVLSAALVALGGVMQGHFVGTLTTTGNTYFNFQFIALAMLVVGGMRSLSGAVVGVVLLSVLSEILRRFENGVTVVSLDIQFPAGLREVGLGLVMLAILIYRPRGLFGDSELSMAPLIRRLWSAARSTQHAPRAAIDDRSN